MAQNKAIETGIESDDRADAEAVNVDPDVWAYADGSEYAMTWAVERIGETTVRIEYHVHEAGLDDVYGPPSEFPVEADKSTAVFARELAEHDPEEAINISREYWK